MIRFSTAQMAELNDAVKPRLAAVYAQSAALFTKRGQKFVERSMTKGTVGGDVGMQLLFEPALLLSLVADGDPMYETGDRSQGYPVHRQRHTVVTGQRCHCGGVPGARSGRRPACRRR